MKSHGTAHRRVWWVIAVIAVGIVTLLSAQANEAEPTKSLLLQSMETMGRSYRKLRRQISEPSMNEASIKLVAAMQKAALIAIGQVPPKAQTLPQEEQAKFVLAYKRRVLELIGATLDVEAALLDGDNVQAQKAHRKLGVIKRKGHDKFQDER